MTKWMHNFKEIVATQQWEELKNYKKEIHSKIQRNLKIKFEIEPQFFLPGIIPKYSIKTITVH